MRTEHDRSDVFAADNAPPSSSAFENQPEKGRIDGFDFYRDPLNAKVPKEKFEAIMKADVAAKPSVMATQRKLLEARYDLEPRFDPEVKELHAAWDQGQPPYLLDGRCLTLEDTVEFFNLVLGVKLDKQEKADLVAFLRQL